MGANATHGSSENPILCSPYEEPHRHWELDQDGRATDRVIDGRRPSSPAIPVVPGGNTPEYRDDKESTHARINDIRRIVSEWRSGGWQGATTVSKTLLAHWQDTEAPPLYWAQIEAVETLIWLYEVAPSSSEGRGVLDAIGAHNAKYNSDGGNGGDQEVLVLNRLASKMATGTGKTTVMALIIAWQGCNAGLDPKRFSSQFVVMSPSTTIRKRLAELDPQYRDNMYESMSILPPTMRKRLGQATVLVRTYHAFQRQDMLARLGAGGREKSVLRGRTSGDTREDAGAMVRRVLGQRLDFGRPFIVINDEAHHCYKPGTARVRDVSRSDTEKAALWYNAIRHMAIEGRRGGSDGTLLGVYDLSATPRFIERGEARADALFPWTVSDFPLTDSIECGMVKIPRVPVGRPIIDKTLCRNIYANTESDSLSADSLPDTVERPLNALYSNYAGVFRAWKKAGWDVPPVFVIVANTIENANELARYVSTERRGETGGAGRFDLFANKPGGPVRTLLVHSSLAEGDLTDGEIKKLSVKEMAERLGRPGEGLDAVREALDTVGKAGRLGEGIRCVISVSMLTEGWDARNVTHIFGFRRFGTQLICEQVVGRALRRPDTENPGWHSTPEYADIFGVPFNYMLEPTRPPPPPPPPGIRIQAEVSPNDALALKFPMVTKYDMLKTSDAEIELEKSVEPYTLNIERLEGVYGDTADIDMPRCPDMQSAVYAVAAEVVKKYAADAPGVDRGVLFTKAVPIVHRWIDQAIENAEDNARWICSAQNMGSIVELIRQACRVTERGTQVVPHPTVESVSTTKNRPYSTVVKLDEEGGESDRAYLSPSKCSHTAAACDSALEKRVAKTLDKMPTVKAWMRNHRRVGWCLPYYFVDRWRLYYPDFVARVDAGNGGDFFCIIEVKGQDNDQARAKAHYARNVWTKAVNSTKEYGRWAFIQISDEKSLGAQLDEAREAVAGT